MPGEKLSSLNSFQGGIHLFIGYFLSLFFENKKIKYGIMVGSILPDADLPVTILMVF
jgi:hypothetical protein